MRRLSLSVLFLALALGLHAQSWWTAPDRHQYNDETVVYAALQLETWSSNYCNSHYRVAAFIDDECRAIADAPETHNDGSSVFVLRVLGDRDSDKGKSIRFEVCCKDNNFGLVYDVTPTTPITFDGESWGRPSQPIVMHGDGFTGGASFRFNSATIAVGETVDIVSLYQDNAMPKYEEITLSNTEVASLDGTVVTGLQPGEVWFTVRFPGISIGNVITVIQPATALNLLIDEIRVDIALPETLQTKAEACYELLPANTTDIITWLIDDPTIVGYDAATARLLPLAVGETYIEPVVLAADGSVRLRPADGRRIHVIIYENIPLQGFVVSIGRVAVGETTPMTLTPVPANATFDPQDFNITMPVASPAFAHWQAASYQLVSREPFSYNVTGLVPGWANIEIWPKDGSSQEPYPLYSDVDGETLFDGFGINERLAFSEGWQWRTNPYGDLDAQNIEAVFGPSLIEARTQQELLYNDPELGYFGTIMTGEGIPENMAYKVKMQNDAVGYLARGTYYPSWSIVLEEGWTWIPTYYFYDRQLTTAFAGNNLPEGTVIVSKEDGSAEWNGTEWEGDLQVLPTRQSFLCYYPDTEPYTLQYASEFEMPQGSLTPSGPSPYPSLVGRGADTYAAGITDGKSIYSSPYKGGAGEGSAQLKETARRFRDNMTMVATVNGAANQTLLAYVGDELRGIGSAINGRYHLTVHADGGERISLRLLDADGYEWPVDEQFTVSQLRLGSLRQPVALHSQAWTQGINNVQRSTFNVQRIYDLQGRPVKHPQKNHIYIINHKKVRL